MTYQVKKLIYRALMGMPLAGAFGAMFMNLTQLQSQILILIVLVWAQVFFVFEVFLMGK